MRLRHRWIPAARACVALALVATMLPGAWARDKLTIAAFPAVDEIVRSAVGEWKKIHPDIDIQVVSRQFSDHHTAMTTALSTSFYLPDVMALEVGYVGRFARGGGLEDLSRPPYNAGQYKARYAPYTYAQATSRSGAVVAVPTDIGPGTLLYRKDVLDKAGVSEVDLIASWEGYLRNYDAYEGHSWASGLGLGEWGNNQESSSEAINAWAGLILWGEVTRNKALRDLGIYLYTSEVESINFYWFDIHRQVLPPEYKNVEVSMLFGGKYAHNTWWTDEPRQIHGINLLPIAAFSTYLGRNPAFIKRNLDAMAAETVIYNQRGQFPPNPPPKDVWQDVFAKYLALSDPAAALKQWDRYGSVEGGETRTHTLHWMLSLQEMGLPDFATTADTPLYSVFKRTDGRKTYLACNAGKAPLNVNFSDGKTLTVAPGALGRSQ